MAVRFTNPASTHRRVPLLFFAVEGFSENSGPAPEQLFWMVPGSFRPIVSKRPKPPQDFHPAFPAPNGWFFRQEPLTDKTLKPRETVLDPVETQVIPFGYPPAIRQPA